MPDLTTGGGNHVVAPADFATIYNVSVGNIDGTGQGSPSSGVHV